MDAVDRALLKELQRDATQAYAALGQAVGLSAGSAHERVRKLRESGVIRRTTIDVDPAAVGRGVLALCCSAPMSGWATPPPGRPWRLSRRSRRRTSSPGRPLSW
ncbi:Lrp/AsnC family transcriptional regulator [Streptosporangium lutulentum]